MVSYQTWKNFTFLIGLAWLLYGALFFDYPDWDIPVSLLMAGSTYLTADRFIQAIKEKRPLGALLWSIGAWWAIDGVYWVYWTLADASVAIRAAQWPMSACLYLLCGLVWTAFRPGTHPMHPRPHPRELDPPDLALLPNETDL